MRNPTPLTGAEQRRLGRNVEAALAVKRSDCTFYNECLGQAVEGNWKGFGCHECVAYCEPEPHQKMADHLALRALGRAAELVEEFGKVHRVPGVKQGADAKRTVLSLV